MLGYYQTSTIIICCLNIFRDNDAYKALKQNTQRHKPSMNKNIGHIFKNLM